MNLRRVRSNGFASFIAIITIAAVGVALAMLGAGFASQVRRTNEQRKEAQLRQLLLAGAAHVGASLRTTPSQPRIAPMELPEAFADSTITFDLASPAGDMLAVTVTASSQDDRAQQTLTLRRFEDGWRIVGAALLRPR